MKFSLTALTLLAATGTEAVINGIAVPDVIKPGSGFNAIIISSPYIQSVYDVGIAFGYVPDGMVGSLGPVLGSYYLGPEQSNRPTNFTKWVDVPANAPKGAMTLGASLHSLYGASGVPTLSHFNVSVEFGDYTSTNYVSSFLKVSKLIDYDGSMHTPPDFPVFLGKKFATKLWSASRPPSFTGVATAPNSNADTNTNTDNALIPITHLQEISLSATAETPSQTGTTSTEPFIPPGDISSDESRLGQTTDETTHPSNSPEQEDNHDEDEEDNGSDEDENDEDENDDEDIEDHDDGDDGHAGISPPIIIPWPKFPGGKIPGCSTCPPGVGGDPEGEDEDDDDEEEEEEEEFCEPGENILGVGEALSLEMRFPEATPERGSVTLHSPGSGPSAEFEAKEYTELLNTTNGCNGPFCAMQSLYKSAAGKIDKAESALDTFNKKFQEGNVWLVGTTARDGGFQKFSNNDERTKFQWDLKDLSSAANNAVDSLGTVLDDVNTVIANQILNADVFVRKGHVIHGTNEFAVLNQLLQQLSHGGGS
ncbi:hypothetical protein MKZ38_002368 [Zalerion maritima]|uniref:Uncharacterized protein n=1 Tax=Zalerion maritima TaxID=339359 RepID=A0AAD5RZC2_9PEZI|nr:hypothetical protein MKZ38_002368 [Zalerion maritima]